MAIHHRGMKPPIQLAYGMTPIPVGYDYISEFHANDLIKKKDKKVFSIGKISLWISLRHFYVPNTFFKIEKDKS